VQTDNSRTLVITIKGNISHSEGEQIAARVRAVLEQPDLSIGLHLVDGADRIYVGSRPDKRARLEAIQSLPTMTATQVAARLGLTERQVYRYRALLKTLSGEPEAS